MSLQVAQYLNLGTFRKTGVRVDTPVWFAMDGDSFYVLSNNQAGKVKRLKNSSRCQIAPCTMLGKVTGPWEECSGVLIEEAEGIEAAHSALKKKYGFQMKLLDAGSRLGGKFNQRSWIRVTKI